jgi:Conserved TM helix
MNNMLNNLNNSVGAYLPGILGAIVLLIVAWLIASLARLVVGRLGRAAHLDQRLHGSGISDALGQGAFWLVLLLSLPGILGSLRLQNVLEPIQGMLSRIFAFLPNLFGAGLILVIGWFVAGLARKIITGLLNAVGLDRFASRMGLRLGDRQQLSGVVGLVAYVLILVPVIVGALNALSLAAVSGPVSNMLNRLLEALPNIFAATLIVGFAFVLGRLVDGLVTNVLAGIGFDKIPPRLGFKERPATAGRSASKVVGTLAFVTVLLFGAIEASRVLGFAALGDLISALTVFGSKLLMGAVIFFLGLFLANLAASSILASDTESPRLFAAIARFSILFVVAAMALGQMGLARDIVNLAFGLLLGSFAVAAALAFGLGGRDTAGRMISQWYSTLRTPATVLPIDPTKRDVA